MYYFIDLVIVSAFMVLITVALVECVGVFSKWTLVHKLEQNGISTDPLFRVYQHLYKRKLKSSDY